MKNRFCMMGKTLFAAMCLLSTCGITYSCSDDYDLDETTPSFLGASIYDELKAKGFNTTVRLIEDLEYDDVLAKTGSKTLFVASDEAYAKFFQTTTWTDGQGNPIRSYEQLSTNQKKLLLNNAMLNNAYVMEMMSNIPGGTNDAGAQKNLCLRQATSAEAVDTIAFMRYDQLPVNYNEPVDGYTPDTKYWAQYTTPERGGIYLATDETQPMMTHFLERNMKEKEITHADVSFIMNDPNPWVEDGENRSYIFNRKVVEQDVVCLNGYFHVLDSVLVAPSNMAEMIRTNGSTKLFSHMLDRFSAPFYDADLTWNYGTLNGTTDSVFVKRYFALRTSPYLTGSSLGSQSVDPKGTALVGDFPYLKFDPGWNAYRSSDTEANQEQDMAAMFVPSDEAMNEYFIHGGGVVLMERYAKRPNTPENLEYNLDQIPLTIVQPLINNLMKASFIETLPSKYLTIMNDARDEMFPASDYPSMDDYKSIIDRCLLANNGVVYVLNRVMSPADYASVIAPSLYLQDTQVMRTVVRADDAYVEGQSFANAPLQRYYSTYLKAMQSRFSFFVPTDEGFANYGYVDPASLATGSSRNYRYWVWTQNAGIWPSGSGKRIAIDADAYAYDITTGPNINSDRYLGTTYRSPNTQDISSTTSYGKTKAELLMEMADQHIVVHDIDDVLGMRNGRRYFESRNGAPVVLKNLGNADGIGMEVNGGFQEELAADDYPANDYTSKVQEVYDQTKETNGYGNGMTYIIDRPMQPATRTVYGILNTHQDNFGKFLELCTGYNTNLLQTIGFRDSLLADDSSDEDDWQTLVSKYRIFVTGSIASSNYNAPQNEQLVRFFNNYRYTVYIPTNEAVETAIAKGLPTWESISQFAEDHLVNGALSDEDKAKAQAMVVMLVNFLKYHFQDQALYVDNVTSNGEYQTSCIDNVRNIYLSLYPEQTNGQLRVRDVTGNTCNVKEPMNLLARDANFNAATSSTTSCKYITNSSYAVVHQIDNVLNFTTLEGGRYDTAWSTKAKAKAFVTKYRIRK